MSFQFTSQDLETKDCRGRTPLLLAVTLGHLETTKVLIEAGADVNCEKDGWSGKGEFVTGEELRIMNLNFICIECHLMYTRPIVFFTIFRIFSSLI